MALALGLTMGQLDMMPHEEYVGWQEYLSIEPVGTAVHDYAQAHIASVIANVNRDVKKRPHAYEMSDFLLFSRIQKAEQATLLNDPEEQTKLILKILFNKKDS